ncbi:hypothetical protein ACVWXB_002911 [Streptomyces sp. TE12347]
MPDPIPVGHGPETGPMRDACRGRRGASNRYALLTSQRLQTVLGWT